MPFKSESQRKYLWSQKPEVARKFASHGKEKAYAKAIRKTSGSSDASVGGGT